MEFFKFSPGLVGGHCLPVDPYYLSYFAKKSKFNTKITLAGREQIIQWKILYLN